MNITTNASSDLVHACRFASLGASMCLTFCLILLQQTLTVTYLALVQLCIRLGLPPLSRWPAGRLPASDCEGTFDNDLHLQNVSEMVNNTHVCNVLGYDHPRGDEPQFSMSSREFQPKFNVLQRMPREQISLVNDSSSLVDPLTLNASSSTRRLAIITPGFRSLNRENRSKNFLPINRLAVFVGSESIRLSGLLFLPINRPVNPYAAMSRRANHHVKPKDTFSPGQLAFSVISL